MKIDSNKKLKRFFNEEFSNLRKEEKNTRKTSRYFGEIGSTKIEDIEYSDQLNIKKKALQQILSIKDIDLVGSPEIERYRLKMEFVCSHDPFHEPFDRFGQRKEKRFNWVVDLEDCILVPEKWFTKTRELYLYIKSLGIELYDLVSFKGNFRYLVLKNFKDKSIVTVVSKEQLTQDQLINISKKALELGFIGIEFQHNPSQSDVATGDTYFSEGNTKLTVELINKKFLVGSNTFFQNNISGFEKLANNVAESLEEIPNVNKKFLYDLYCGVGTLGILYHNNFENILGIDNVPENIELLKENLELNNISNYKFDTGDLNKTDLNFEVIENQTVIVDPPRSGLMKNGVEHVLKLSPKFVIYISCNPITQQQDLELFKNDFEIIQTKGFDLFPQTYHMESVVVLRRK